MVNNASKIKQINTALWLGIILTVAINIIFLMRYNFEADSAFYVTLAQEQIRTCSLFPEGMHYSTGLFVLSPNLLVIPFLFVTDNLVLARQLAILLLWFFVYFVLYIVFVSQKERNLTGFIIASSFFSLFFIDASFVSMHFYQGAYVSYLLLLLLFIALMNRIVTEKKHGTKQLVYLLVLYIIANLGEIRNLLIWGIPGLIAYVLYIFVSKEDKSFKALKNTIIEEKTIRTLFDGILIAFIICLAISKTYGTGGSTAGTIVIAAKDFGHSFCSIIVGLFNLYGNSYEASLLSGGGILKVFNFLVALTMIIFIPVFAVKSFNQLESESGKFIVLFSLSSSFVYLAVAFFTGVAIAEDRYLIPVYNNNILVFAVVGSYLLKKYYKESVALGICCILTYVFVNNLFYFYSQKDSFINHKFGTFAQGIEGVTEFLEDKGLQYGYATFFNAEEYSILSNNKVRIRGIFFDDGKIMPYNWLTADSFYKPDYYVGKSFLMITEDELKDFLPQGIEQTKLGQPIDFLRYKKYLIYIYDYNIASNFVKGKKVYYLIRGNKSGIYFGNH